LLSLEFVAAVVAADDFVGDVIGVAIGDDT
jgi:hypothetical protein